MKWKTCFRVIRAPKYILDKQEVPLLSFADRARRFLGLLWKWSDYISRLACSLALLVHAVHNILTGSKVQVYNNGGKVKLELL